MALIEDLADLTPGELDEFLDGLPVQDRRVLATALEAAAPWSDPLADLTWAEWHQAIFPDMFTKPYAPHHVEAWDWFWAVDTPRPDPLAMFWPRGHAKSATSETGVAALGARRRRMYWLYVSATQEQADDHVTTIGAICESPGMEAHYPEMADRAVTKHGQARGWRRNRLWASNGFVVDALGLDTAKRGAKLIDKRPDGIVFDDIDDVNHSVKVVARNLRTMSRSLLPTTRGTNAAIILAQNFTHPGAIAVKIHTKETDVLARRHEIGPFPAVRNLEAEPDADGLWRVTGGEPTWEGMDLDDVEEAIQVDGWLSFNAESQQDVVVVPGALLVPEHFEANRVASTNLPTFDRVIVAVDPNKTGRGDDAGVVVLARGEINGVRHSFTIADFSDLIEPAAWRDVAARAYLDFGATAMVVESSGVGELAELAIKDSPILADHPVAFVKPPVKGGKGDRARPVAQLVKDGRHHHVGVKPYLQRQWTGWDPELDSTFSPGAVDAEVHGVTDLLITPRAGLRMRDLDEDRTV